MKNKITMAILAVTGCVLNISTASASGLCTSGVSTTVASNASQYASDCPQGKSVSTFSGDAKTYIKQFDLDIKAAGKEVADQSIANTTSLIEAQGTSVQRLIQTMVDLSEQRKVDQMEMMKSQLDMEMNFETELAERELRAERAVMNVSDTKEEIMLILSELPEDTSPDGTTNHMHLVIQAMKQEYDEDPEFMLPTELKSSNTNTSETVCAPYDPETHKAGNLDPNCFLLQPATPGATLQKYFEECSRQKRESLRSIQTNIASKANNGIVKRQEAQREQDSLSESSATASVTNRLADQRTTSCTKTDLKYEICIDQDTGEPMTEEKYITKVINNEIVPHGETSSSNFLTPSPVGSIDGDLGDITEEELKSIQIAAQVGRDDSGNINPNTSVSSNTVPLDKTYRTSSQYFAARDFVNNLLNRDLVPGLNLKEKNQNRVGLQSRMMSRKAVLSLAESSLMEPMKARTGLELGIAIEEGTLTREGIEKSPGKFEVLKEDLNGAGELDMLSHAVNEDYSVLSTTAANSVNGGGVSSKGNAASGDLVRMNIDALILQNKMLLKQYEAKEREELLLATEVAQQANSPEMIEFIKQLRRE